MPNVVKLVRRIISNMMQYVKLEDACFVVSISRLLSLENDFDICKVKLKNMGKKMWICISYIYYMACHSISRTTNSLFIGNRYSDLIISQRVEYSKSMRNSDEICRVIQI